MIIAIKKTKARKNYLTHRKNTSAIYILSFFSNDFAGLFFSTQRKIIY